MSEYEIDTSTLAIIGISINESKVITLDKEYIIKSSSTDIVDNTCKFFGSSLSDRIKMTKRLANISVKSPVIVEEIRNLLFFPLKSTREKNNVWISFNNIEKYDKLDDKVMVYFKCGKSIILDCSYYIFDNQVTRSLILDYEHQKRLKSLQK